MNLNADHVGDEVGLLSTIPQVDNTGHSKDEEGNLRNLHRTEETSASYADMTKIYTEIAAVRSNVGRIFQQTERVNLLPMKRVFA